MQQTEFQYPIFEANQVLTNDHLNDIFEYLDEQGRLTRANLIGIGIVCGLEFSVNTAAATINLSRGCGISSQGYLLLEPEDVVLTAYREYLMPLEVDYPPFKSAPAVQYPLWELFPAGTPSTTPLNSPANFLGDKALLLFLELKKEGLRNCSPNDCNDKGSEITATVRRLLIRTSDLEQIISKAYDLNSGATAADIEGMLMARLNLPDIRLPRYDVPNTSPVTSNQVYASFLEVFRRDNLATNTGNALTAAYNAFRPIVEGVYPANPFGGFAAAFGFLDTAPQNAGQVRFLQYYYDLFDDLLKAYDELRAKGMELMCACCPSEDLFPRHLMLGALSPSALVNPGIYRHHFLASAAVGDCENRALEVMQLFRRLVEMTVRFTNAPPLPAQSGDPKLDSQIRITPSKLGDFPLSEKAIPYYYRQNGTPALFQLWNPDKTRRRRANQNLGYRSDEYTPIAPEFVTNPLGYDLEPNNFLRIEGHLGKPYQSVLQNLLHIKSARRLPIEIIALRTGEYDENMIVNLSRQECRFQDLEAIYDVQRAELLCTFCMALEYFYNLPFPNNEQTFPPFASTVPLLAICSPGYMVQPRTMGAYFESLLWPSVRNAPYFPPTQEPGSPISQISAANPGASNFIFLYIVYYLAKFMEVVKDDLLDFDLASFETRVRDIAIIAELIERNKEAYLREIGAEGDIPTWEEMDDRLDALSKACHLDAFQALHAEYTRRIRDIRRKQFLSHFLQHHPGIQHKAGVPLGGTFIVVYHDPPQVPAPQDPVNPFLDNLTFAQRASIAQAFERIVANPVLAVDAQVVNMAHLLGFRPPVLGDIIVVPGSSSASQIIATAVNELPRGTVIADFFLPYICCSDCAPIQFILPSEERDILETCEYRWASRDSYLRDLTRDYVFTILQYRVNGADVVDTPHTIAIPVEVIRSQGLQAVVDALNGLGGLVFGLGTTYSYLTIQRYQSHSFELVIQEEGENDVFTYSPDGVRLNGGAYAYGEKINCTHSQDDDEPQPCTLPCDGVVQTCRYPWRPIDAKTVEVVSLSTIGEDGNAEEIQRSSSEINTFEYQVHRFLFLDQPITRVNFNELINAINRIFPAADLALHELSFSYEGNGNQAVGNLVVSRYICHDFRLRVRFDEQLIEFRAEGIFREQDGTMVLLIPSTGCTEENRCP